MPTARELADRYHAGALAAQPFEASRAGIPGYDDAVPDASADGDTRRRDELVAVLDEAGGLDRAGLGWDDAVTLGCVVGHAEAELALLDTAAAEHTVTAMPFRGPAQLMGLAARTVVVDADAAADYVVRLRRSGRWIDQQTERLREGAAKGRLPVAPLVDAALAWTGDILSRPAPDALVAPEPPEGWDGATAWRQERDAAAAEVVAPALARWAEQLRAVLPDARPPEKAGLAYLPGGDEDYARCIRAHTTLEPTPDELHHSGLAEIERLEDRALRLGAEIGLGDLGAVHEALRRSAGERSPEEAVVAAREAVRRAEAAAGEAFPSPLPPPCAVEPMPAVVGAAGTAPHYTPPRLDGGRPGTYWFNTQVPTAGAGWDLESVAFHEAVPGHHLQLSRLQLLSDLPDLQRHRHIAVFSEGWGLYAEGLAEEMGLYRDERALLGAVTNALMRAARLVVDTGLHAFGWGRAEAVDFFAEHVPLPAEFLAAEVDRYIMWPGQALAYLTGKLQIAEARQEARRRLGDRFALPAFHAATLDHGSLPMAVYRRHVARWAAAD